MLYYDRLCGVSLAPRSVGDPLGNFLGQFTDETDEGPVIKFASSGAKNYGYLTRGGKTECKVSGFFLNFKTKQTLNYSSMRDNPLLLTFTHFLFQGQTKLSKSNYQNTRQEGHCFMSLFLCPEF